MFFVFKDILLFRLGGEGNYFRKLVENFNILCAEGAVDGSQWQDHQDGRRLWYAVVRILHPEGMRRFCAPLQGADI